MKKAFKLGLMLCILTISINKSFAQTAGTQGTIKAIPEEEARLVITIVDETDFQKTIFDWKLEKVKDAATASALATNIKSKNASIKNISVNHAKLTTYLVHIEANSPMEAYQYFQMFVAENVKYAMINGKPTDLVSYIKKKTGK
jgi:hypothetical protein